MQLSSVFLAVVAAVGAFAQTPDPSINTPTGVQECLPSQLTFSGTSPPFSITVVPQGQAGAAPLVTVGTTSANAITWVANLPAGSYTLVIRDSLGRTNPSGVFTINTGDATCLTASASAAPATSAAAATSPPAATSAAPATSAAAATTPAASSAAAAATSAKSAASVVSTSAAAAATSHNAAPTLQPMGIAGLVGLAGVAALL